MTNLRHLALGAGCLALAAASLGARRAEAGAWAQRVQDEARPQDEGTPSEAPGQAYGDEAQAEGDGGSAGEPPAREAPVDGDGGGQDGELQDGDEASEGGGQANEGDTGDRGETTDDDTTNPGEAQESAPEGGDDAQQPGLDAPPEAAGDAITEDGDEGGQDDAQVEEGDEQPSEDAYEGRDERRRHRWRRWRRERDRTREEGRDIEDEENP